MPLKFVPSCTLPLIVAEVVALLMVTEPVEDMVSNVWGVVAPIEVVLFRTVKILPVQAWPVPVVPGTVNLNRSPVVMAVAVTLKKLVPVTVLEAEMAPWEFRANLRLFGVSPTLNERKLAFAVAGAPNTPLNRSPLVMAVALAVKKFWVVAVEEAERRPVAESLNRWPLASSPWVNERKLPVAGAPNTPLNRSPVVSTVAEAVKKLVVEVADELAVINPNPVLAEYG
ncbi:hypothetical protein HYW68_00370 [Candidatus Parcubacteria bacterium]|nr:hypothetical protein [Candidatus Parcubacteria bacterium]